MPIRSTAAFDIYQSAIRIPRYSVSSIFVVGCQSASGICIQFTCNEFRFSIRAQARLRFVIGAFPGCRKVQIECYENEGPTFAAAALDMPQNWFVSCEPDTRPPGFSSDMHVIRILCRPIKYPGQLRRLLLQVKTARSRISTLKKFPH